jgi:hypothetical protein
VAALAAARKLPRDAGVFAGSGINENRASNIAIVAVVINWSPVILLAATVILGVFYQTHHFDKRFEDLKEHFNKRLEDQRDFIRSEIKRLEDRLEHVYDRVNEPKKLVEILQFWHTARK